LVHYRKHSNNNIITPPQLLQKAFIELGQDMELYCEDDYRFDKPHWAFDNFRLGGAIEYGASHLFYTQPSWGKFFIDKIGINKVKCVTYAIDKDIYPKIDSEKIYDVGFVGNILAGDKREEFFNILKSNFNCFISSDVPTIGIADVLSRCKVLINPQRFEEVNIRFFEDLACGAQVVSYSPALHLFAEEGKHYLTYKTPEEAVEKIKYLLENDQEDF
jgi:hypothetical protein